MSDNNNINFSVAEKYSYVYADEKYAKLAVSAGGDAKLVDPLAWSYAETHSYVKVDPSSVGVEVPSGVEELYAKVLYIAGGGGGGGSSSGGITINDVKNYLNSNHYVTSTFVASSLSSLDIPEKLSDLQNDTYFITSSYVDEKLAEITIPRKLSDLENDADFVTEAYVISALSNIEIPEIPAKVSTFENDAQYVSLSVVQEMMSGLQNNFNLRLMSIEARLPSAVVDMGEHGEGGESIEGGERDDNGIVIDFGERDDQEPILPDPDEYPVEDYHEKVYAKLYTIATALTKAEAEYNGKVYYSTSDYPIDDMADPGQKLFFNGENWVYRSHQEGFDELNDGIIADPNIQSEAADSKYPKPGKYTVSNGTKTVTLTIPDNQ